MNFRLAAGLTAITATAVTIFLASPGVNATVGDAIYVKWQLPEEMDLSAEQTDFTAASGSAYTGYGFSDLEAYKCWRSYKGKNPGTVDLGTWRCSALKRKGTPTDTEALDLVLDGNAQAIADDHCIERLGTAVLDGAQITTHDTFSNTLFGVPLDQVAAFECSGNVDGLSCQPGEVENVDCRNISAGNAYCVWWKVVTEPPATWITDFKNGKVLGTIGKVEP